MKNIRIKMIGAAMFCLLFIIGCGGGGGGGSQTVIAEPDISLSETSYDFVGVVVKNSAERQFTISSTGTRTLHVGVISSNKAIFSIPTDYDNCSNKALAVGATCTFIVRYEPVSQSRIPESCTISIPGDVPATVALSGSSYGLNVWINEIVSATCAGVVVDVTLTDPNNVGVTFAKTNFEPPLGAITQGSTSQTITAFSALDPDSVSAVLALDLSVSLTAAIGNIRTAAAYFINNMAVTDEAAIFKFKTDIEPFPPSGFQVTNADPSPAGKAGLVANINNTSTDPTSEGTALYDAVYAALTRAKAGIKSTRAVILLSDGYKETGGGTLAEVITYANTDPKVPVFTIYYVDPAYAAHAKPGIMHDLANQTGGQDFYAERTNMNDIFEQIWAALTKKYRITYIPTSCTQGLSICEWMLGWVPCVDLTLKQLFFPEVLMGVP